MANCLSQPLDRWLYRAETGEQEPELSGPQQAWDGLWMGKEEQQCRL